MIKLPEMIVLEFFDWLKNDSELIGLGEPYLSAFIKSIEKNNAKLLSLADAFLHSGYLERQIFHSFVNSKEFSECFKISKSDSYRNNLPRVYNLSNTTNDCYMREVIYRSKINAAFDAFYRRCYMNNDDDSLADSIKELTPELLVDNLRYYVVEFRDRRLNYMMPMNANTSVEVEFLEWLMNTEGVYINLNKLPVSKFRELVEKYSEDSMCDKSDKEKLIRSFKQNNPNVLWERIKGLLKPREADVLSSLGYIFGRYSSSDIKFRCIFLRLASEAEAYEKFISNNWIDLNCLTGDYLDVYYSEEDFGTSGYDSIKRLHGLAKRDNWCLPCLVIWEQELQKAKAISVDGLDDRELMRLMEQIVNLIKVNKKLDDIVREANNMVSNFNQQHRDSSRPVVNNNISVTNNTGVVSGIIENSSIDFKSGSIHADSFQSEAEKAIEIINSFKDVDKGYRDALIDLVKEADRAVQSNNVQAQSDCKSKFKGFILGAGKAVDKITTKLAELVTIATFFGITAACMI